MARASGGQAGRMAARIRGVARRAWRALDSMGPLIDIRMSMTMAPPERPLPRHGQLVTDGDVLRALARLRERSGWERLEISRGADGSYGGYCTASTARRSDGGETADLLARDPAPEVIIRLRELIDDCGWQRLEALSDRRGGTGGWCERADGSGVRWPDLHNPDVMRLSTTPEERNGA